MSLQLLSSGGENFHPDLEVQVQLDGSSVDRTPPGHSLVHFPNSELHSPIRSNGTKMSQRWKTVSRHRFQLADAVVVASQHWEAEGSLSHRTSPMQPWLHNEGLTQNRQN